ncbi:MAG: methylthioribulose-1-phosphate dehydratase [Lysobacterales bacterium CG02_land_8_20_14_3_00_62_12]|nr:MAG: methylthioribulose-1-phosphate dehydratase [Xanthomonadales bacterium CG02_land_8_20_14_3_00_62_12]
MIAYHSDKFTECATALVRCGQELAALGYTPATSSNFSLRLDAGHIAITISGRDKGLLGVADIMVVDLAGLAVGSSHRPSAETRLHTQLYQFDATIGCVLHTHSRTQTVASRLYAENGMIELAGYELLKAFDGYHSHEARLRLPVLANHQQMPALAESVQSWLVGRDPVHGYLIDGHGIYTWGRDLAEARRHLEAFEFLLGCELDLRNLRQ